MREPHCGKGAASQLGVGSAGLDSALRVESSECKAPLWIAISQYGCGELLDTPRLIIFSLRWAFERVAMYYVGYPPRWNVARRWRPWFCGVSCWHRAGPVHENSLQLEVENPVGRQRWCFCLRGQAQGFFAPSTACKSSFLRDWEGLPMEETSARIRGDNIAPRCGRAR